MPSASELIERGWKARQEGLLGIAETALTEAVRVSREAGEPFELARALKALAHVKRDLHQDDEGLLLCEEAATLNRRQRDMVALAHTVRHLGDIHRDAGRSEEAERCYLEAAGLYEEHPEAPPLDVANALRPLALLREHQGRIEESRELWSRARRLYAEVRVDAGVRECDKRLAGLDPE